MGWKDSEKEKTNYIRTLNIDEPLVRIKSDGTVRYYHPDALSSIIALSDETGAIKTQYIYDPFGNTEIFGEASDNPFQYTGRENDGTGLYYYRARYYSPELQRFISEDPSDLILGINPSAFTVRIKKLLQIETNLYQYVQNNPIFNIDPMGLVTTGGGIGGAFVPGAGLAMQVQLVCTNDKCGNLKCCTVWSICACLGVGAGASGNFTYCSNDPTSYSAWGSGLTIGIGPVSGGGGGGCYTVGVGPSIPIQAYYCWCMATRSSCD